MIGSKAKRCFVPVLIAGALGISGISLFFAISAIGRFPLNPIGRFAGTVIELTADWPAAQNAVEIYLDDKYGWASGTDYVVESVTPIMDTWNADRLVSENFVDISPGYVGLFHAVVLRDGVEFPVFVDPAISWEGIRADKCSGADGYQVEDILALVEQDVLASCETQHVSPLSIQVYACGGVSYDKIEEEGNPYTSLARRERYEYSSYYEENLGVIHGFEINAEPAVVGDGARVLVLFECDTPPSTLADVAENFSTRASSGNSARMIRLQAILASAKNDVSQEILSRLAMNYANDFDLERLRKVKVLKEDLKDLDALPPFVDYGYQYAFEYDQIASAIVSWNSRKEQIDFVL